jgi:hypothetical protein
MRISAGVLKLCVVAVGLCCLVAVPTGQQPARGAVVPVPIYQVDPFWPKSPLPKNWIMEAVPVMATDYEDHIWVISRSADITPDEAMASTTPPRGDCCIATDSLGNIYTGEVRTGKRVQKFVLENGDGVRRMRPLNY